MNLFELHKKKSEFAVRNVGSELILVPVRNNIADMKEIFTLNEAGTFIWECIDGKKTEDDIIVSIIDEFDIDEATAKKDLLEFLMKLDVFMNEKKK